MVAKTCVVCGNEFNAVPARTQAKCCSNSCRYVLQKTTRLGESNGRWKGGDPEKPCQFCGGPIKRKGLPFSIWQERKFCSKDCVVQGQKRFYGTEHPRFNPQSTSRTRLFSKGTQREWSARVMVRDDFVCQSCGKRGGDMHAHHIKPWKDHPELRFDVSNGTTLCVKCHRAVHGATGKSGEFGGTPNVKTRAIPSEAPEGTQ